MRGKINWSLLYLICPLATLIKRKPKGNHHA